MGLFDKGFDYGSFGPATKKPKPVTRNTLKGDELKILERQNHYCAICGKKKLLPHRYHVDHIKPIALGGQNILSNKQALCPDCHDRKSREDRSKIAKKRQKERESKKSQDEGYFRL